MIKKLIKHGNFPALVKDKPILDLLKINEQTPLEIEKLDGKSLQIMAIVGSKGCPTIEEALKNVNKKFGKTLKNLTIS